MKTKDVIALLQEVDPTGEEEVCVGNADILYIQNMPAYYDGALQVITRENERVIGAKYKRTGRKIDIHTISVTDVISDHPDVPIDYSELSESSIEGTKKKHEDLREFFRKMYHTHELENFCEWVKKEALKLTQDVEYADSMAKSFFEKNIKVDDPIIVGAGESYVSKRHKQWTERFELLIEDGFLKIKVKDDPKVFVME